MIDDTIIQDLNIIKADYQNKLIDIFRRLPIIEDKDKLDPYELKYGWYGQVTYCQGFKIDEDGEVETISASGEEDLNVKFSLYNIADIKEDKITSQIIIILNTYKQY